jgi:hypothetical protein
MSSLLPSPTQEDMLYEMLRKKFKEYPVDNMIYFAHVDSAAVTDDTLYLRAKAVIRKNIVKVDMPNSVVNPSQVWNDREVMKCTNKTCTKKALIQVFSKAMTSNSAFQTNRGNKEWMAVKVGYSQDLHNDHAKVFQKYDKLTVLHNKEMRHFGVRNNLLPPSKPKGIKPNADDDDDVEINVKKFKFGERVVPEMHRIKKYYASENTTLTKDRIYKKIVTKLDHYVEAGALSNTAVSDEFAK